MPRFWTKEEDDLLRHYCEQAACERALLGRRSKSAIYHRRQELGLLRCEGFLGIREFAQLRGLTEPLVRCAIKDGRLPAMRFGRFWQIPADTPDPVLLHGGKPMLPRSAEMLARLGRDSDAAIAQDYGVTRQCVSQIRRKLVIPRRPGPQTAPRRPKRLGLTRPEGCLGIREFALRHSAPDSLVRCAISGGRLKATQLGGRWYIQADAPPPVRLRGAIADRYPADLIKRLGHEPDKAIAEDYDLSVPRVYYLRRCLGITATGSSPLPQQMVPLSPAKLRARRRELGLTQIDVSARMGSRWNTTYGCFEWALRPATPEMAAQVAAALQCRVCDLTE